jgi:hypothetical protein
MSTIIIINKAGTNIAPPTPSLVGAANDNLLIENHRPIQRKHIILGVSHDD